jgi:hypothetical protein
MIGVVVVALIAAVACVVLLWPKNKPAAPETTQVTQQTQPVEQTQPAPKKHGHKKHHSK